MPLKSLRHHDFPTVWCGTSLSACEACEDRCKPIEQVRLAWRYGVTDPDHYHADPKVISVTETLLCLRKPVLERMVDYAESVEALAPRSTGTAMHVAYQDANDDGASEVGLAESLSRGYLLRGTADRLTGEYVMDYKSMDSFRKTVDRQHEEQLSIYAQMAGGGRKLLLAQMTRKGLNIMEVEEIDGALDNCIQRAEQIIDALEAGDPSLVPPAGREIKFNRNRQCDYCPYEVRQECERISPVKGEE